MSAGKTRLFGYRLFPFPTLLSNNSYFYIQPTDNFLWIDDLLLTHAFTSSMEACKQVISQLYICTFDHLRRDGYNTCEGQLLRQNSKSCEPHISRFSASIYRQVSETQWLFLLSKPDSISVRYPSGITERFPMPRSGIITLPLSSTAFTSDAILKCGAHNSTHFNYTFHVPEVPNLVPSPPTPVNLSFPSPNLRSLDVTALKETEDKLKAAISDFNKTKSITALEESTTQHSTVLSFLSWILGSFSITTWIAIALIILLVYKYRSRQPGTGSNPVQITVNNRNDEQPPLLAREHPRQFDDAVVPLQTNAAAASTTHYNNNVLDVREQPVNRFAPNGLGHGNPPPPSRTSSMTSLRGAGRG